MGKIYHIGIHYFQVTSFDYGAGVNYFLKDDFAVRCDIRNIQYRYESTLMTNLEFSFGATLQFGAIAPDFAGHFFRHPANIHRGGV